MWVAFGSGYLDLEGTIGIPSAKATPGCDYNAIRVYLERPSDPLVGKKKQNSLIREVEPVTEQQSTIPNIVTRGKDTHNDYQ